jgi:hypothetical protein
MKTITYAPYSMIPLVLDHPFTARVELKHEEEGTSVVCGGLMARDGEGRWKYDICLPSGERIVRITDPGAETMYVLDITHHIFLKQPYLRTQQMWVTPNRPPADNVETRLVEGLECYRLETTLMSSEPGETRSVTSWVSPEVGLVAEEFETPSGPRGSWRLFEISLAEPDSNLFEIPPGFQQAG